MSGEIRVIGAYLSNRLFRNAEEAGVVKKQLRRRGVKLYWLGKPTGMDERDPSLWLMERNTDTQDEWHSRQTGWMVGRQLEFKTRKGEPIGALPEMWEVAEWAPGYRPGQRGRPIRWNLAEPMATIVRQGAVRYLAGASYRQLADWSALGESGGLTPLGRLMDWEWWRQTLKNPKIAGLHYATRYPGYKGGKESPTNKEQGVALELVPCLLPPLVTSAEYEEIQAVSLARHNASGPFRARDDHRVEILSGIAYDARCGHRVHTSCHVRSDYVVRCGQRNLARHGSLFSARHAGADLDAVVASIALDETLLADIEMALSARVNEQPEQVHRPSPAAIRLRAAIAAFAGDDDLAEERRGLETKLRAVEAQAPRRLVDKGSPAAIFRRAVASLANWGETWEGATPAQKNAVLRAAGLRVFIEPTPNGPSGRAKGPGPRSRLVSIEADVPEFALALALACGLKVDGAESVHHRPPASIEGPSSVRISLPRAYRDLLARHARSIDDDRARGRELDLNAAA
jgi:hypothetical protein